MRHVPEIEARKHFPIAKLHASLLNALGGKPDPSEQPKKGSKPIKPHLLYTPEELLVHYASFSASVQQRLTRAAALDIMQNLESMPAWALQLVPVDEARAIRDKPEK